MYIHSIRWFKSPFLISVRECRLAIENESEWRDFRLQSGRPSPDPFSRLPSDANTVWLTSSLRSLNRWVAEEPFNCFPSSPCVREVSALHRQPAQSENKWAAESPGHRCCSEWEWWLTTAAINDNKLQPDWNLWIYLSSSRWRQVPPLLYLTERLYKHCPQKNEFQPERANM
jgi:hypothetical protein